MSHEENKLSITAKSRGLLGSFLEVPSNRCASPDGGKGNATIRTQGCLFVRVEFPSRELPVDLDSDGSIGPVANDSAVVNHVWAGDRRHCEFSAAIPLSQR